MAVPTVNDIDGILASLNDIKPPGASRQKIQQITTLAVNNIKSEPTIVQSLYRALKKAPATHKLGALYVIDSVVRQWIDVAQKTGQNLHIDGRGEPGTLPAAVKRVTELMPALFDDTVKEIPAEQKPKLAAMVGIWERGGTFPVKTIQEFKTKLNEEAPSQPAVDGASAPSATTAREQTSVTKMSGEKCMAPRPSRPLYTPVGFPPQHVYDRGFLPGRQPPQANGNLALSNAGPPQSQAAPHDPRRQPAQAVAPPQTVQQAPSADVNSILAALSMAAPPALPTPTFPPAPQQVSAPAPPPHQLPPQIAQQLAQIAPGQIPPELAALFAQQGPPPFAQPPLPQHQYQQPQYGYSAPPSAPPIQQAFQAPAPQFAGFPPQPPPSIPQGYGYAPPPPQPPADPLAPLKGILPENILNDQSKLVPALQLLQDLQNDGIPPEKWGPVLKAFEEQFQPPQPAYGAQGDYGRNGRGRSRSPDRGGRGGRGSPVYGSYDADIAKGQGNGARDGKANGRNRFRQRSPQNRNSPGFGGSGRMQPKTILFDPSLPPDNIKVLSRTLFVGGANGTQQEIQQIFERFGQVQTCIANRDKRHAFVKMTTREFALNAKAGMEDLSNRNDREVMNIARQTKWGVGFGPRECCDYQRGESIIPIHKLTDADNKWLLTAEYGGTGGKPIEGGMVLEEPDIEIGAGVSSKAMSKRVDPGSNQQHNSNNNHNNNHNQHHHGGGNKRQERNRNRHKGADRDGQAAQQGAFGGYSGVSGGMDYGTGHYARPEPVAVATPPAVPGFGFSLAGQQPFR